MQSAALVVELGGFTNIGVDLIHKFRIFSYLDEGLPYGYINVMDKTGELISGFENLQIGTPIRISMANVDNPDEQYDFPIYYVLQLNTDCSYSNATMAGLIQIWFGHGWFLHKDTKNHAYPPINSTELIKNILDDETRGMIFPTEDDNFDDTDDSGTPRFKVAETDWDFIKNKIVPYCTAENQPVHFFCSDHNTFYLKSFKKLYSQTPKIIFTPSQEHFGESSLTTKIGIACDSNNLSEENGYVPIIECELQIGDFNMLDEIAVNFSFEGINDESFFSGISQIGNQIKPKMGLSFGNKLPLDANYLFSIDATSTKIIRNRPLTDSMSLLFNGSTLVDNLFKFTIKIPFIGDKVEIGNTAEFVLDNIKIDGLSKKPWICGKWLISGVEHFNDELQLQKVYSEITLIRPAFVGSTLTTSLALPVLLYSN